MPTEKAIYFKQLTTGGLTKATINKIEDYLKTTGLTISPIPPEVLKRNEHSEKITEYLTRLDLAIVEGNPSWEGLLVGFPGDRHQLSTSSVGTPYLRMILYPILDLHHRIQTHTGKRLPCIYFVGERFSDVFLRKFELLKQVVPNIIVLTHDLYESAKNTSLPTITEKGHEHESWTQMKLSQKMNSKEGLSIYTDNKEFRLKFLCSEVPCSEGTENPERLDVLGNDANDHALVAFELKGENAGRIELENLFLQGMEHRNWLEKNKMAIKLLFDGGPKGKRINTRKRVRLLIGYYGGDAPHLFDELRTEAIRRDPHLEIGFVKLENAGGEVFIRQFS